MRQLTALDQQFLALEDSRNYGHIGALSIYDPSTAPDGTLTLPKLQSLIAERLPLVPPFRWRLVQVPFNLDYGYWIDDPEFDIEFHVRELALAPPGTDAQLAEQVARIYARPLDRARPLWELYLIHGLPNDRVAVMSKIHHAVIDGISGAEIMGVLFDRTPEIREPPPPLPETPRSTSGRARDAGARRARGAALSPAPAALGTAGAAQRERGAPAGGASGVRQAGRMAATTQRVLRRGRVVGHRPRHARRGPRSTAASPPTGATPSASCRSRTSRSSRVTTTARSTTSWWRSAPAPCGAG